MVSVEYSEAAVEVLGILDYLEDDDKNRIPREIIEFLEKNKSNTYNPEIDYWDDVRKLKLKVLTPYYTSYHSLLIYKSMKLRYQYAQRKDNLD